ncbi:transposase, partial [Patescibacteria group bacterium]|nr:transposase [Patescibacteria group bacterium]
NYFKEGDIEYYFTYIKFDPRVRRMIYTTNSIENLNRQIRKTTKNKLSFESPDRLLDYLFMVIKEFEEKNYMKYSVTNYKYFKKMTKKERASDTLL